MKYLGILISVALVSSCVVMTKNSYERQNECKVRLYGQYWGDCYIEITESDPAFSFQINSSVGIDRWNLLKLESADLHVAVNNNVLTVAQANYKFISILEDLKGIEDQKKARTQEQFQVIGRTGSDTSSGMMYTLSSDYVSGMNRICIYKLGSQTATHTMKGIGLCPISKRF